MTFDYPACVHGFDPGGGGRAVMEPNQQCPRTTSLAHVMSAQSDVPNPELSTTAYFINDIVASSTKDEAGIYRQGGGLLEIVQTLLDEKITDPGIKQLVMSKLPEIQGCLMGMVSMTPQVAMQVIDQMIPALNDCGTRISSASEDQRSAIYVSCSQEAVARVKTTTGMGADDAKIFDDGMACLQKALGF
ncbi:uncharacterized protein LOC144108235 [Amblyomma americanum]